MARRAASSKPAAADAPLRIVVLYGDEPMLKRQHFEALRQTLRDRYGEVETLTFDGAGTALADVLDELRSYGLMQQYKLVVVDDADQFVSAYREALQRYAAAPVDHGTLLLRSVKWNKGNLDKAIEKVGYLTKCEPLKQPAAERWLIERAASHHRRKLDQSTAKLLVRRLGVDLARLDAELAKLSLLAAEDQPIETILIDQVVGRGSDEDAWAVQEAVLAAINRSERVSGAREASEGASRGTGGGDAILKIHELVDLSGQPAALVAYFIADLIRKLHVGLMMKRQGAPDKQIAEALKLWGGREIAFMAVLRKLNDRSTTALFDRVMEMDHRAKTGRGETMRNLECFCTLFADELK